MRRRQKSRKLRVNQKWQRPLKPLLQKLVRAVNQVKVVLVMALRVLSSVKAERTLLAVKAAMALL
jgi:hypothetical protein